MGVPRGDSATGKEEVFPWRPLWSPLGFSLCCFGVFLLLRGSGEPITVGVVVKMTYSRSLLNGVCYGSEKLFGLPCLPAVPLRRLKCHGSWEKEEILPCPVAG